MKLLAMETTARAASCAVLEDGAPIASRPGRPRA